MEVFKGSINHPGLNLEQNGGLINMYHVNDKEHKQLANLLETIHRNMLEGQSQSTIFKHINDFVIMSEEHFKNEEKLMDSIQYPQIAEHKKEHARLLDQLKTMKLQLDGGQTPYGEECLFWLKNWQDEHTSTTDKKLEEFLSEN